MKDMIIGCLKDKGIGYVEGMGLCMLDEICSRMREFAVEWVALVGPARDKYVSTEYPCGTEPNVLGVYCYPAVVESSRRTRGIRASWVREIAVLRWHPARADCCRNKRRDHSQKRRPSIGRANLVTRIFRWK